MYHVILYYNFRKIKDPQAFCIEHKGACQALNLKGRVYIAKEGINGTLAGTIDEIERYKKYLWSIKGFSDTEFKEEAHPEIPFDRLKVKVRSEIVALKAGEFDPRSDGGKHLSPEEWRKALEQEKDYVLLDVRNNYESAVGRFEGAICPDVENFYDFPQWLDQSQIDKSQKVFMYCTGGIRCEKFSAFMRHKGFSKIYQLHGGILNYAQKEGGKHFQGKCFVFDDRLATPTKDEAEEPLGRCEILGIPCDTYLNCANLECNKLFLCSQEGAYKYQGCCSEGCMKSERRRPFDEKNIYAPSRRQHTYLSQKN